MSYDYVPEPVFVKQRMNYKNRSLKSKFHCLSCNAHFQIDQNDHITFPEKHFGQTKHTGGQGSCESCHGRIYDYYLGDLLHHYHTCKAPSPSPEPRNSSLCGMECVIL